jgi:hypothetical protein
MDAIITDVKSSYFKPFTIAIDVKSEDELLNSWHRFNVLPDDIHDYSDVLIPFPHASVNKVRSILSEKVNKMTDYTV